MCVNGWFFDIYIQGSKKSTTLRAESEIKTPPQGGERVSVIKESRSKERIMDALVPIGDEGRGKLR